MAKGQVEGKDVAVGGEARPRFILVHGDKGGVGKSMVAMTIADILSSRGQNVAVLDADTRNPDVERMFDGRLPTAKLNLRSTDGWMDVMDFVAKHPTHTVVLSLPAGIGESMSQEFQDFCRFLGAMPQKPELVMFWVMNCFVDSINLLEDTIKQIGSLIQRLVVVRNNAFGDQEAFLLWNESPLKKAVEGNGAVTINFPALHLRITSKLFRPDVIMPFSVAMEEAEGKAIGLSVGESYKLRSWFSEHVPKEMGGVLPVLMG